MNWTMAAGTASSTPLAIAPLGFKPEAYVGLFLIICGTLAGAWSARRWRRHGTVLLPAACGVLLALAVIDILPRAIDDAGESGLPGWAVPVSAVAGFTVLPGCGVLLARCGGRGQSYGNGTAAALVLHRVVEGMTVALLPTFPVVAALALHSGSEGLALTTMLETDGRRRLFPWLVLACLSPLLGGLVTEVAPLPDGVHAVLMAVVAGVLLHGAVAGLALLRRRSATPQRTVWRLACLAMGSALAVTTMAVMVLH
ncbi:hypothetical protein ACFVT2_13015 [Streptomyces sp. NPDC058000]|uniref:hypothetical protein n=1 Tax=Streptomyces sp. NPDC058000 TaxID=3346299 RepID=UPI0036E1FD20